MYGRFLLRNHLDFLICFGDIQGCSVSHDVSLCCLQMVFGNFQVNQCIESIKPDLKPIHSSHLFWHLNLLQIKGTGRQFGDDVIEVPNIWFEYCFSASKSVPLNILACTNPLKSHFDCHTKCTMWLIHLFRIWNQYLNSLLLPDITWREKPKCIAPL